MKNPEWLEELHRQWLKARGKSFSPHSKPFTRDWTKLLEQAGVHGSEDLATATREVEKLEKQGLLTLKRHRYRTYIIQRVALPLGKEHWLHELFSTISPSTLNEESLLCLKRHQEMHHAIYPNAWQSLLQRLATAFQEGRNLRPFHWTRPDHVDFLLETVYLISSRVWESGSLVRHVSTQIGLKSKDLEKRRRQIESALSLMLDQPFVLEGLGIRCSQPRIEIAGDLTLHFPDGTTQRIDELASTYQLTSDLERANYATTKATRILSVENTKTTLRLLAEVNEDKDTLLIAGTYPGEGFQRLLQLLPQDLPAYHFGDTDPAGYLILSKIRAKAGRTVNSFLMSYRASPKVVALTEFDRKIIPTLMIDPLLGDVHEEISFFEAHGCKGDFEQESLGKPDLPIWPFYSRARDDAQVEK